MKEKNFDVQGDAYVSDALSCTTFPCHAAMITMTRVEENEV